MGDEVADLPVRASPGDLPGAGVGGDDGTEVVCQGPTRYKSWTATVEVSRQVENAGQFFNKEPRLMR